ncbi:MATE family efflux transporter [Methyloversatilis thermotolerans]|uniref:MATE family efflux transporter n=1 Tax=Methyloversatilis thermotolerans TaxID=1346290 RepID=UPI000367ACF9|nr:MATE family efflux transporter [Methyloversatilis thermotolerans]
MSAPHSSLARLALPLLLNSLMGLATTLIDTMIISAHGKASAAAVSLANQILVAAYDLSVLLGVGATILVSHALGRGERDEARAVARVAIVSNALLGVLIGIALVLLSPVLIGFLNVPPELVADVRTYVWVIAIAMPFNGFLMAGVSCLRGFAHTRTILLLGLFAFPSYLLLDYLLVLGAGPVPGLGVLGSALATLAVRVASVLVLLFVLVRVIGLDWRAPLAPALWRDRLRRLAGLSSPSVLDNVAYGFYQLTLVSFIAGLGVAAVVSRFYVIAITAFLPVLIMAISQANEVIVGYRHGAGELGGLGRRVFRSGAIAAALATLAGVAIWLFADPLVGLFSDDAEVLAQARTLLWLTIFLQPLSGLNTVLFHSLRVLGDVHAPVLFSQAVMWCVAVPLAWLFCVKMELGVAGLWYAMLVEEAAKTAYMVWRWSGRARRAPPLAPVAAEH